MPFIRNKVLIAFLFLQSFVRAPDEFYYTLVESAKLDACLHTTYPVFDSLNQLGSTPWKINGPILDLVRTTVDFSVLQIPKLLLF